MPYTNKELRAAILAVTDQATLIQIIDELRSPRALPFTDGQVVVHTSTGKPTHWDSSMRANVGQYRGLNLSEVGSEFVEV